MAVACSGSDDGGGASTAGSKFEIAESDLLQNLTKERTSITIPISTDLKRSDWSVKSNADWLVAGQSSSGSAVAFTAYESEEPKVREAAITVTSAVKTHTIVVKQLGYGPAILLKKSVETVDYKGGAVSVEVTTNVDYKAGTPSASWLKSLDGSTRGFVTYNRQYTAEANPGYAERSAEIVFSDARTGEEELAESVTLTMTQDPIPGNPADVEIEGDIKLKVTGGQASEAQSGYGIDKSYDGDTDPTNHYHSRWSGATEFPVTLEYFFDGSKDLDYIVYHSRNGNGNFGVFNLYIATQENGDYQYVAQYDLKGAGGSSRIDLPTATQAVTRAAAQGVTKVKFEVISCPSMDGTGSSYVSCAEMEFFCKNTEKTLDGQLLTVFTDLTCTELKEGVTDKEINALPAYFGRLAVTIRDNLYSDYEREFRIQEYKPYSVEADWANELMLKHYSSNDNPTGITVKEGDEIIILVGDTYGNKVSVRNIGEEQTSFLEDKSYPQTEANGTTYLLQEGVNKITPAKTGMLFLVYNTDLTSANATPIKVHIPVGCGEVGGYWCKEKHGTNDKFTELIDKSDYKYFCVRGNNIIFYFHRKEMKEAVNGDILSAINLWDDIVGWELELMGLEDIRPAKWNNHLFAISPEGSYMWASDYRVAFVYTYLKNILVKENVQAAQDNAWGPAHEIGHIHQKTINWPSCSESSNNLFSNYVIYKLGKYCSRGSSLDVLAKYRYGYGEAWVEMGSGDAAESYQGELPELHMRMFWQLWNYFHRCGKKSDFYPTLFKLLRQDRIVESDPGAGQLKFAVKACEAANMDLTDFFDTWGFFKAVSKSSFEQYGTWNYQVTSNMIAEAKAQMAKYSVKAGPLQYLEDRKTGDNGLNVTPGDVGHYDAFKENRKITKTVTCTRNGRTFNISNGDEAVAFELKNGENVIYFSNLFNFTVPDLVSNFSSTTKLYAVQADGERILVE